MIFRRVQMEHPKHNAAERRTHIMKDNIEVVFAKASIFGGNPRWCVLVNGKYLLPGPKREGGYDNWEAAMDAAAQLRKGLGKPLRRPRLEQPKQDRTTRAKVRPWTRCDREFLRAVGIDCGR